MLIYISFIGDVFILQGNEELKYFLLSVKWLISMYFYRERINHSEEKIYFIVIDRNDTIDVVKYKSNSRCPCIYAL